MQATSFGTGELIRTALGLGVREIILGIGGSATVDGGIGMAQALGYGLATVDGSPCGRGGKALTSIARIDASAVDPALARCRLRVACDVINPLLGPHGAARVFGPQKGATPGQVELLEMGLAHLAEVWRHEKMLDSVNLHGDGAAGGLGAGLRAFCGAEIEPGAALVAALTGFDDAIAEADLLVTGEGRTDVQTTTGGKLCAVLAAKARTAGVRTILLSGSIVGNPSADSQLFDASFGAVQEVSTLADALRNAPENLRRAASNIAAALATGQEMPHA
jgi:glycerate kinase